MKKLVTAFALCAAISAMAVESENIVGYQTVTTASGFTVFSPTFLSVGGTPIKYKDISGTFEMFDNLQFFDANGDVTFLAQWLTTDAGVATDGWYDGETLLMETTIPAGTGFFVYMANPGSFTVKGQVNTASVTVTSISGFTVTGNCMPKNLTYGDLVVTGIEMFDNLQFFDANGDVSFLAQWLTTDAGVATDGWYDGETLLTSTVIPAGQGFFFYTANPGVTLQIPAPL